MKCFIKLSGLMASVFLLSACGKVPDTGASKINEAWIPSFAPDRLEPNYENNFAKLPTSGSLDYTPWADSYWPSYNAGIAARWETPNHAKNYNFKYKTYSLARLKNLSQEEIANLSPAEKLDIAMGNYSYPTVTQERNRTSPKSPIWEGLCHGWASAAINFIDEPQATIFTNEDGIEIPFGSSDVKGLLSYYQGELTDADSKLLGLRCNVDLKKHPRMASAPACKGVNAGSFHIILANFLGIKKQGFVADVTRDQPVWNHPVYAFSSNVIKEMQGASANAAPGTVRELTVKTKMSYRVESEALWEPSNNDGEFSNTKTYNYVLEIDANDNIIGGTWLQEDRPDFLWTQDLPGFDNQYSIIGALYQQSIQNY